MVEPVEVYACDIELTGFTKQDGKFVSLYSHYTGTVTCCALQL